MTELRQGSAAEAGMVPERVERIRALARSWVDEGTTPSLVVLAARRGVIVLHEAFGRLRPDPDFSPLRVDSIFPMMSISKPVTATAAMLLVEDGLLGLNRPVRDYLPEISGAGTEEVLVHHLLTHTSGYDSGGVVAAEARKMEEGFDPGPFESTQHPAVHRRLAVTYTFPLSKPAGSEMIYGGINYILLGEIIRRLSGRSLEDLARERMFGPLNMNDSFFVLPDSLRRRIVKRPPHAPFVRNALGFPGIDSRESEETPSAGNGLFGTARDLAVFGQMFLNGGSYARARILSRSTVAAMTRNQISGISITWHATRYNASYGYGWDVESTMRWKYLNGSLSSNGSYGHVGSGGVAFWVDPLNEVVGVYLSVQMRETEQLDPIWNYDLFQNAVTAAVAD
jgi:CubicO group peptidase (beta-lactamase class C family)